MTDLTAKLFARYDELKNEAYKIVPELSDGSRVRQAVRDAIADLIEPTISIRKQAIKEADAVLEFLEKPGVAPPDSARQLFLPGFEPLKYEKDRLITDDLGNVIENSKALPRFKSAKARRARDNAAKQIYWANIATAESDIHQEWALEEALKGRKPLELTWETCVIEKGLLR